MPKILSNKSYAICKTDLSKEQLKDLKKNLTVTPLGHTDYPDPQSFSVYNEGVKWIRLPRAYGIWSA